MDRVFCGDGIRRCEKTIMEGLEKIIPTLCFAEAYSKTLKVEGEEQADRQMKLIKERRALAPLDESVALKAAKIDIIIKRKVEGVEASLFHSFRNRTD